MTNKDIIKIIYFSVNYSISFGEDEAYKKECQIKLKIMPCYTTCDTCSKDYSASNQTQHNCIKCKNNYYPSPLNKENCYSIEEKYTNWYLDISRSEFALCDKKCKSCSGPNEYECTSCSQGLFLENGSCKDNCSQGYI